MVKTLLLLLLLLVLLATAVCRLYLFPALSDNPSTSLASGRKSSFVPNVIYGTRSSLCQAKQNRFDRKKKKKKKKKKAKSRVQSSSDSFLLLLPFRPKCVMQKSEKGGHGGGSYYGFNFSLFFPSLTRSLWRLPGMHSSTQPAKEIELHGVGWGDTKKKSWERCRSVFIAEFFQRKKLFRFILDI